MKKFDGKIAIYDLLGTYYKRGEHSFRVVLNPKLSKKVNGLEISIMDPDRDPVKMDIRRWGTKFNCTFTIGDDMPEGVCVVRITSGGKKPMVDETVHFWVIR